MRGLAVLWALWMPAAGCSTPSPAPLVAPGSGPEVEILVDEEVDGESASIVVVGEVPVLVRSDGGPEPHISLAIRRDGGWVRKSFPARSFHLLHDGLALVGAIGESAEVRIWTPEGVVGPFEVQMPPHHQFRVDDGELVVHRLGADEVQLLEDGRRVGVRPRTPEPGSELWRQVSARSLDEEDGCRAPGPCRRLIARPDSPRGYVRLSSGHELLIHGLVQEDRRLDCVEVPESEGGVSCHGTIVFEQDYRLIVAKDGLWQERSIRALLSKHRELREVVDYVDGQGGESRTPRNTLRGASFAIDAHGIVHALVAESLGGRSRVRYVRLRVWQ